LLKEQEENNEATKGFFGRRKTFGQLKNAVEKAMLRLP
jgi:hypothetical protein